jgi:hypothetical protein
VTLDDDSTVEFTSVEVSAPMQVNWNDIAAGNFEPLLVSLDAAAEAHHSQLSDFFLSSLDTLTEATGNRVDAAGKSFFEYTYEMFDKIELTFEADGTLSPGFTLLVNPETYEAMKKKEADMTQDERRKLDELMERKRQEYFARRRRRKLS